MSKITPTKANLIKSKSMLEFSKKGYKLLDKKRNILVKEMMARTEEIKKIRKEIDSKFEDIYLAMIYLNMTMGENAVEEIALSIPKNEDIKILSKSIMGVEVPYVRYDEKAIQPYYGFYRTNPALDIVVKKSKEVQKLLYRLTEYENAILRIAEEIKKTTKRANALDKIKIPNFEETTKEIEESLEEKERQEFFRLKSVKKKL
jgi:V/A-type H+-transporting ATPase subunit D